MKTSIKIISDGREVYRADVPFSESAITAADSFFRDVAFDIPGNEEMAGNMIAVLKYSISYFDGFAETSQTGCRMITSNKTPGGFSGNILSCDVARSDPKYRTAMRTGGNIPEEK